MIELEQLAQKHELILIEEVGHGSFGTVYRAHDPKLDRPVALKLLQRTAAKDEQLKEISRSGSWVEVETSAGKGWISSGLLAPLSPQSR